MYLEIFSLLTQMNKDTSMALIQANVFIWIWKFKCQGYVVVFYFLLLLSLHYSFLWFLFQLKFMIFWPLYCFLFILKIICSSSCQMHWSWWIWFLNVWKVLWYLSSAVKKCIIWKKCVPLGQSESQSLSSISNHPP